MALAAQTRSFQSDRARPCANVPDHTVGAQLHAGQGHHAHFVFRNQAFFGVTLLVAAVRKAQQYGRLTQLGAPQQHHVRVSKRHGSGGTDAHAADDPFFWLAQAFGHGHLKGFVQTFTDQHAGDAVGRVVGAGQNCQPVVLPNVAKQGIQAVAGPGFLHPLACVFAVH